MSKELQLNPEEKKVSIVNQYTNEQLQVIKQHIAVGATNDELIYFLQVCKAQNLDPLSKQIYFVKRGGQMNIQTGIDGYRAMAEQSGTLAGIDDPVYDTEDAKNPNKATVTVYKMMRGVRTPFTASARWSEYVPSGGQAFMWNKMPYLMLGKVAEALALRKAFPKNLGGVYTEEEMAQSGGLNKTQLTGGLETMVTAKQIDKLKYLVKERGRDMDKMVKYYNRERLEDFSYDEAEQAMKMLESLPVVEKATTIKKEADPIEEKEAEISENFEAEEKSKESYAETAAKAFNGKVIKRDTEPEVEEMPDDEKKAIIEEIKILAKEKKVFMTVLARKYDKKDLSELTMEQLDAIYQELSK